MGLGTTEAGLGNARRESAKAEKSRRDRFIVCFPFVKYLPDDPTLKARVDFARFLKGLFHLWNQFPCCISKSLGFRVHISSISQAILVRPTAPKGVR